MRSKLKSVLGGHLVLNSFQLRRVELDDLSADRADHVIVMLVLVIVLVMRAAIAESRFAGQPRISQKLQRTIDGGLSDARVLFAHQAIEIVAGDVTFGAEKYFQDQVALRGSLEALSAKMFDENFLFFGHRCLSGGRLVPRRQCILSSRLWPKK